jgi:phosphoribosylamine--glycine ligase
MAAEDVRYTGFLYAGLMINKQGQAKVIEYNCRFGDPEAQPVMMRLQSDLVELCLAACEGKLAGKTADWDPRYSLGVVLAASGYPGTYESDELIRSIPAEDSTSKVFHAGTRLDRDANIVTNGGRVLCAVSIGETVAQAQQKAYQIVAEIDWPNAYFRTDIGFKAISH